MSKINVAVGLQSHGLCTERGTHGPGRRHHRSTLDLYIDPHIAFNPLISFQVIIMALLGGPYRVAGPVLGALVLAVVSEVLLVEFRYVYLIFLGSLLIATVLYMPHGLAGTFVRLGQYWSRWRLRLR